MEQAWESIKNMALGWGVPPVLIGPIFGLLAIALLVFAGAFLVTGIPESTATPVLPTPADADSGTPSETPVAAPPTPIALAPPQATPGALTQLTATPVLSSTAPTEVGTATPVPATPTVTPTPTPTPIPLVGRPVNPGLTVEQEFREGNLEFILLFDYSGIECVLLVNITEFADDGFALGTKLRTFTDTSCDGSVEVLFGEQYNLREPENEDQFVQWDKDYADWLTKMDLWEWVKVTELSP